MNISDPDKVNPIFYKQRIEDRVVDELIGISRGIVFDGIVSKDEVDGLYKWLVANKSFSDNLIINNLMNRIEEILKDDVVDEDEAKELLDTLTKYSGSDFELGELLKSSTLPIDDPVPEIIFENKSFCFTGTFAYGNRKECTNSVISRNGIVKNISGKLDYLIIGIYATDAWVHSTYGRKIEKAIEYKSIGRDINIISEVDYVNQL